MERILGGIYVSSIEPLNGGVDLLNEYNITHILSVLPGAIPKQYTSQYNHKQIEINDDEYTDILQYIPECNKFIRDALFGNDHTLKKHRTSILIHCAQGVSRSVTFCALFLMQHYHLSKDKLLYAIKRKMPIGVNDYFAEQLLLYEEQGMDDATLLQSPQYREFKLSYLLKLDPSGASLINDEEFYDSGASDAANLEVRCKKCRATLASSAKIIEHEVPDEDSKQSQFIRMALNSKYLISLQELSKTCSHFFLEPIIWMKDELSKGELEGKFLCTKCDSKIGGYCWQGSRCSCGKWMNPALYLQSAKVDCFDKNKDVLAKVRVKASNVV